MTFRTKLLNFFYDFGLILVGGLPLAYLIYRRLFNTRTPKDIIWGNITTLQGLIYFCLFILFFALLIYTSWKKWFCNNNDVKPGFLQEKWLLWLEYMNKGTDKIYDLSHYILPNYGNLLYFFCNWLHTHSFYFRHIILLFVCVPKILVTLCFLFDIFYFSRFEYFYLSLYILLLPLTYRLIYYLLQKFYEQNHPKFQEMLLITDIEKDDFGVYKVFAFKDKTLHSQYDLQDYLTNLYYPITSLLIYLDVFSKLKEKYALYTNLFMYSAYAFGWGYLFFCYLYY